MDKNISARFTTAINNIANFIITGNRDREKALKMLNDAFQESFVHGEFANLCIADICKGVLKYKNEFSHPHLKTGLRITIVNDIVLTRKEIITYAKFFGGSKIFVRRLMVLGFDTLILQPKNNFNGVGIKALQIGLKSFANSNLLD